MNFACLAGCKTNTFTLFSQALLIFFFKEIYPLSVMLASVSVNVIVVKLQSSESLPLNNTLQHPFFNLFFTTGLKH
jgi:hypothetical protein